LSSDATGGMLIGTFMPPVKDMGPLPTGTFMPPM